MSTKHTVEKNINVLGKDAMRPKKHHGRKKEKPDESHSEARNLTEDELVRLWVLDKYLDDIFCYQGGTRFGVDPQAFGFDTWEEMQAALDHARKEDYQKYYDDIVRYALGEPNDIDLRSKSGKHRVELADIAKELIAKDGGLASPDRWEELLREIHWIYYSRQSGQL